VANLWLTSKHSIIWGSQRMNFLYPATSHTANDEVWLKHIKHYFPHTRRQLSPAVNLSSFTCGNFKYSSRYVLERLPRKNFYTSQNRRSRIYIKSLLICFVCAAKYEREWEKFLLFFPAQRTLATKFFVFECLLLSRLFEDICMSLCHFSNSLHFMCTEK
jgi:hypothetical protein